MSKVLAGAIGFCAFSACATSQPQPTEQLAASMAAVRGAETAGAAQIPQAALHLKLARDQITQAEKMIEDDDERADAMAIRAYGDAELALALTREAQAKKKLEGYAEAHPEVRSKTPVRGDDEPLDATNPPGIGAPSMPAVKKP
jgi:hypothetical protein